MCLSSSNYFLNTKNYFKESTDLSDNVNADIFK